MRRLTIALLIATIGLAGCSQSEPGASVTEPVVADDSKETDVESTPTTTDPPSTTTTTTSTTTTTTSTTTTTTVPPAKIAKFRLTNTRVNVGQEVSLQWSVEGSESVELRIDDEEFIGVPPEGNLPFTPDAEGRHTYTLRAAAADGVRKYQTVTLVVVTPKGSWVPFSGTDDLTGVRTTGVAVEASDVDADDERLYDDPPTLAFLCRGDEKVAHVSWGGRYVAESVYTDRIKVQYRVDETLFDGQESETTNNEAVWVRDPSRFLSQLKGRTNLIYRTWNFNGEVVGTATFNIAHLENNLEELPCY